MRTILQVSANGAKVVDTYGDTAVNPPEIMLHTFLVWEFDLRSGLRRETGTLDKFPLLGYDITNWYFAVDSDYDSGTIPKILITEGITFNSYENYTILKVPIASTGTAEMVADMTDQASKRYTAEIGAMDSNARIILTWQFPIIVKNRIYAGETIEVPPQVSYPDYYTAFEVNGLLAAKADAVCTYTKEDIDRKIGDIENQLSEI